MKPLFLSIFVASILVLFAFFVTHGGRVGSNVPIKNVSIVGGKQIIEIQARGGYQPQRSIAKAGTSTTLRFVTSGSFDCSSAVRIPSLQISKNLPSSGTTDIDIGISKQGVLQGMCAMGMYPFEIDFQN
ncbi:hypothetical protein AUJ77_03005 [Candidatus Nomurabacteria bacterium CG1_02_43_90]|uniref:EfeO-type cupredoxin-like domain-containing protein n=1 Tax=Candidatus Nomurabacteria bacterium CG1_02_43_90 TaxID=1805281 RepID=A0A1J4V7H2_9BACT|nr:MAG: hypothetical protein AUJ77_03005 [Candidatus Nomurabacteria bacterium CG1_02_43_90]